MPQLDISTFPSQIFWLIICFAVLCFCMVTFLAPRIGNSLALRQKTLLDYQESAKKMVEEAEKLTAQNIKNMTAAKFEANQKMQQALTALTQEKDVLIAKCEKNMQEKLKKMNDGFVSQKKEILGDGGQLLAHLVAETYSKITGKKLDEKLIHKSINDSQKHEA